MTIGSLAVNITATTDKFQKGIAAAQKGLKSFVSGIGGAQAIVSAFTTYGLASIVTGAIEAGAALYEMTQKLHVSAEALSALHFAAEQLESSAGAVDNALMFMTKTLGKAAQGAEPAIAAFNRLELDFAKLQALSVDKQFLSIVDALHKIPDPAERAAASQAIFGRGSKELAALISAGTDEIIKQGEEASKTGNILSTQTVSALDDVDDAMKRLTGSWNDAKATLVADFGPAIIGFGDLVYFLGRGLKQTALIIQTIWTGALKAAADALYYLGEAWNEVAPQILAMDTGRFSAISEDLGKMKTDLADKMSGNVKAIDNPLSRGGDASGRVQTAKEAKAEQKETAKNTKKANDQLQELINQGKNRGPVLKLAGVR